MSLPYVVGFGNVVCFKYRSISVLRYRYDFKQVLGSSRLYFIVVNFVKMAFLHPQAESIQLETQGLLFSSSANFGCGRQHCLTTLFTFSNHFLLLVEQFQNVKFSLLMLNNSGEKFIGEFLPRLWQSEIHLFF